MHIGKLLYFMVDSCKLYDLDTDLVNGVTIAN